MAIEFYNISPLIYSQEGVSFLVHAFQGRFDIQGRKKKGNSYGKYDKIFCMAWWRDEGREWLAMSGVEMTVRLKVCCLFTQRGRGGRTVTWRNCVIHVVPCRGLSPPPQGNEFPSNRGEGELGRKVGCGCLRSGWPGNVIIFGRDKAKIAFMDRPTFSCSYK